jgi:orotidine-5'-phosphate decarboxylase
MDRSELLAQLRAAPAAERVITALDVPSAEEALALAGRLGEGAAMVKVGLELFGAAGPTVVQLLQGRGRRIFLDLKFHDIPNTVAGAARVAARLGVTLCTMHAAAGPRAVAAAAEALATAPPGPDGRRPALLAVTVLTSLGRDELAQTAPGAGAVAEQVQRLAALAWENGCDGLVCSPADLTALRDRLGPAPLCVTPGIRPAGAAVGDPVRVATPADARRAGADYLVVGRPITRADDPAAALRAIAGKFAA